MLHTAAGVEPLTSAWLGTQLQLCWALSSILAVPLSAYALRQVDECPSNIQQGLMKRGRCCDQAGSGGNGAEHGG